MSIPEAIKGAQAELAGVRSPLARVQRLAVYARIFAAELFGTVLAVPFGVRAYALHRSLPDARAAAGRAGTVSILRDVRYGARCRNVLDIYLPPNVQLPGSGDLLNCWTTASGADWHEGAGTAAGSAGTDAAAGADAGGSGGGAGGAAGFQAGGSGGEGGAAWAKAGGAPVVLLCHGGVWASGSKWHYAPLAARLAQAGVVTAVMQYSLYPQALVPQMVAEVSRALTWTMDAAPQLGGDAQKLSLVGHSAGAHVCTMALLHRALAASKAGNGPATSAPPAVAAGGGDGSGAAAAAARSSQQLQRGAAPTAGGADAPMGDAEEAAAYADVRMPARLVGVAGVYDIGKHYEYEEARHVHKLSTMERAIGGNHRFPAFSPAVILANALSKQRRIGPAAHGASWSEIEADPRELLREAGVADGGVGWRGAPAGASVGSNAGAASGAAGTLVQPAREGTAAAQQEAGDRVGEAPAVAAARYYSSFELAGEAIARRIGFERVAAAEAAAAGDAAGAALAGGTAAPPAGGVPPAAPTPAAARAVPVAAQAGSDSSGSGSGDHAWRIFDLTVEAARRLPPTVLTSSCTDITVPWYESAEMYWELRDCGVPAKHLVYNKVSHGDFVTQWTALPRISGQVAGEEADLAPHAADLVKIVSGRVNVRY